jgi:hypothetical protein
MGWQVTSNGVNFNQLLRMLCCLQSVGEKFAAGIA